MTSFSQGGFLSAFSFLSQAHDFSIVIKFQPVSDYRTYLSYKQSRLLELRV
jgi:hypothetical protein